MLINRIICGDAVEVLKIMPDESVHCCVTSPPFWGLRAYGTKPRIWGGEADCKHEWQDATYVRNTDKTTGAKQRTNVGAIGRDKPVENAFCSLCGAWRGELGLEPTPELYVQHLVEIFREVRRVLRSDGTLWLNMGDCYNAARDGGHPGGKAQWKDKRYPNRSGANVLHLKPKDLVMMPARVAMALQADGWWLRSDIIWAKPNPMPESVRDRPTKSHEYIFLLTKSARYFYDQEAIRKVYTKPLDRWGGDETDGYKPTEGDPNKHRARARDFRPNPAGRNARSVWTIATQPFPEAHFATFPEKLVEPCIKAGTSEKGCCPKCGNPWVRIVERSKSGSWHNHTENLTQGNKQDGKGPSNDYELPIPLGWRPSCECDAGEPVPCVVADFFVGAGTTPLVAKKLGRDFFASDLNPIYVEMANRRLASAMPFFES